MLVATLSVLLVGCGTPPGQPRTGSIALAPNEVVEFDALYADNCAGCHGADGRGGAAIGARQSRVPRDRGRTVDARHVIADGVRGTSMPAFAQRAGGMLTEKQIDAIVSGIRARWSRPAALAGANPPSYAATSAGDARRGEAVYQTFCQSCHGADGRGGPKGSAITNDSFLALVERSVSANDRDRGPPRPGRSATGAAYRAGPARCGTEGASRRRGELAGLAPGHRCRTAGRPHRRASARSTDVE